MSNVQNPTWMCPDALGPGLYDPSNVDLRRQTGTSTKAPMPAEGAETGKRRRFAVRANSILALVECPEQQPPKPRNAIVDAMSRAQTQPN
jgi:hypothetical protein